MSVAPFAITLLSTAARDLEKLSPRDRLQVSRRIAALAENPRPPGCKLLRGRDGVYRLRFGDHRVLYRVEDARLVVLVIRVAHRREVYR